MPFSIAFDHRLPGQTVDGAYRTILAWLQEQKATVKSSRPPMYVEATHGRAFQPMGWRKDARKTIAFDLQPAGSDILVRVRMTPPFVNASDVQMRTDEARANWGELLAELWVRFGEFGAVEEAIRRPSVDWNAALKRGRETTLAGAVFVLIGVGIFAAFLAFSPSLVIAPIGLMTAGVLALINGAMNVRSAKRRIARQARP